jgi:cupin 2 domain-containing protein
MGMSETLTNPPNILAPLPSAAAGEFFQELLRGGRFWLERIVSTGQATSPGEWYDQETDEWVLLVSGAARLRFEDEPHDRPLRPGDYLHIAAHRRHRVAWTDPEQATVWLAVHYTR